MCVGPMAVIHDPEDEVLKHKHPLPYLGTGLSGDGMVWPEGISDFGGNCGSMLLCQLAKTFAFIVELLNLCFCMV